MFPVVRGDREGAARVVVDPAEDFGVSAWRWAPVGEVGLPALVGLFGLEADVRGRGAVSWERVRPGPRRVGAG